MRVRNRPERLRDWERGAELPMLVGSPLFLACYAVCVLNQSSSPVVRDVALSVLFTVWALFAVDYGVRLVLSGQGAHFVTKHWLDTVVLLLPLLRPVRIVNTYVALQRRRDQPRLSLYGRVMAYAGVTAALLSFAAALAVYQQERGAPGATIRTFGDSVWWACSAITTVGYGDVTPVTPLGRLFAVCLMICGLALLGAVTGSFSSWLIQVFGREDRATGAERGSPPPDDVPPPPPAG
ncbi:potassium channel family protein [Streptomyces sp. IB2014 016-6]|uniref:potassium channel family protein n=1 Tax=Streptomyces sp. IB2014 016-6 TaxID=2517818 RepID=UPI0011CC3395|nr:potassium channel family protein [Streptomyces sp. IB2014 016-6]TXL86069.1 two pore domain potassium channel family protein [Streptomyces sp. IB2014 016-6]